MRTKDETNVLMPYCWLWWVC